MHHDSLSFCNRKYKTPPGCLTASEYQVKCDDYMIQWIYMNEELLKTLPDQFITQLGAQLRDFEKVSISPYLFDNEAKGYKTKFLSDNGIYYQLIGYGIANGQPVLVQLTLYKDFMSNDDIPAFARQFIRLTK